MSIITYVKDIPMTRKILGTVIGISSILLITSNVLFSVLALTIGINFIIAEGSQINLENKTYRKIKSIFGIHFGKWESCPEFEYISVFRTRENQTINISTATTTLTNEIILLNLFYNRNKHLTVYKTDNKTDAFKVAEHFKLALDIDILDSTESETKWL